MGKKTYFNGFWGVTGTKALDKSARVALFHGMDPKDSVQEIIALLYDSVYMNYQIQKYVENSLKKIYDEIERKEIENALCVA